MSIIERIKRKRCDHDWQIWWKWELEIFLTGKQKGPRFLALNGEQSARYCPKCGKVEDYLYVPTEGETAFDRCCYHIRRDKNGDFIKAEVES